MDAATKNSPNKSYNLYRYFRNSKKTFDAIKAGKPLYEGAVTTPDSGEDVLARNITSLKIQPFYMHNAGAQTTPPEDNPRQTPDFIDIQLTALNNDTAKRLKSQDQWTTSSPTFKQNARTFTTRVHLSPIGPRPSL